MRHLSLVALALLAAAGCGKMAPTEPTPAGPSTQMREGVDGFTVPAEPPATKR